MAAVAGFVKEYGAVADGYYDTGRTLSLEIWRSDSLNSVAAQLEKSGGDLMGKFAKFALAGAAAAAIAGTAYAASKNAHVLDVSLPDGSVAHIQYYGDVAPKVTIAPAGQAGMAELWAPMSFPNFDNIDRAIAQMNQQTEAMIRQSRSIEVQSPTPGMSIASYGNMPAGSNSISVVSYSNGKETCTRTTQVTSEGQGKPPKVTTNVSGICGPRTAAPESAQPGPLNHT